MSRPKHSCALPLVSKEERLKFSEGCLIDAVKERLVDIQQGEDVLSGRGLIGEPAFDDPITGLLELIQDTLNPGSFLFREDGDPSNKRLGHGPGDDGSS
ncbi:hypothetical protein MAPG_11944 [Magnaporthiopsis poae ATCC 64411]|uniref:Uncharacterized protein n=1 Tax=Magnaporthiopsis poae (strain ATCC 64411 / 73-15) TaxID=644358 RepID=A0A0C4EGJ1_MAGP6|nr:hypothetical protein MAPG_11944 [Magnaporthiopsis poae ATCC 64411]